MSDRCCPSRNDRGARHQMRASPHPVLGTLAALLLAFAAASNGTFASETAEEGALLAMDCAEVPAVKAVGDATANSAANIASALGAIETAAPAATQGFGAVEMEVIREARAIPLDELKAAYRAGGAELNFGGRTVLVTQGMKESGMTLFGGNGFILGRGAFVSDAELTQTLLHELYRLATSQSRELGVSQALAKAETEAAFGFASRAYKACF